MFDFIRTHQRLMQFLLLLLIVPAFAIGFGLQGYNIMVDDPNSVAKVCGGSIPISEFQAEQQRYLGTMQQQLGQNFRPEMFDNAETRSAILDRLVDQRVLACAAAKRNMVPTDDLLRQNILRDPKFQNNGKFSREMYDAILIGNGLTAQSYDNLLRQQLSLMVLSSGVADTAYTPKAVQEMVARAQEEQRVIQEVLFKPETYNPQVQLAADAAKKYYDANQKEFQVPPQMRADFLVLSVDTLAPTITPVASEIKAYYDQNQARYGTVEERRARHILFAVANTAPAAEIASVKAKAEEVLKEIKASPDKFPALAKQYSKDPGSAEKGGELPFTKKDGTFVKPFEDKLFSLKDKEVSDLVQTDYGFHIIQLLETKPAAVKTFEEVRAEIEKEWQKQRAQKLFADSIDGFSDLVYSQPESLKPAADKYKLTVQSTPLFSRANPPKDLNNPALLAKLFSDDAIKNKRNTEAVSVANGVLVSARVAEYKPQSTQPFDEVKARITEKLTRDEAVAMAKKEGEAKLKAAQANPDAVAFGAAKTISRAKPEGLSPDAIKPLMAAPGTKLPMVVGVELLDGTYGLYRINKVGPPEKPDTAMRESLNSILTRSEADSDFSAYIGALRKAAKVELHPENLEKKPGN